MNTIEKYDYYEQLKHQTTRTMSQVKKYQYKLSNRSSFLSIDETKKNSTNIIPDH